ncbi:prepilin peptidase [Streptococcus ratti]|uniref:Signal peptidase type IV n=1 Tax=Streptococcus ratti FA-1 = DSM 20564 TaxID=699248 RepID=A0ABP2R1Q3_STRRT|nr:A24 family peptidase [Streptococcus ratti]EJN95097.1 signal peptidase type IV [Streptococcus ratti FA-1 = DSM 20564]EMP70487.1 signal peptidase type IV [Streptococcus ratti FA-1 = DSM 20564]QEY07093.1 prepilin peptidase [Streptococcus ratti]VEI59517.1 signal peptidase type IV [Streptococcus mutans]
MKLFLFFILGASLGSFLGLVLDRFPERSIVSPRSHCYNCHRYLAVRDLIPIFSQVLNKSHCRFCGCTIPLRYALTEFFCGLIGLGFGLHLVTLSQVWLLLMGILLSLYDLKEQTYPFIVWLGFTVLLLLFYPVNLISIILFLFGIFAALKNINIGSGDFLYLATLSLSLSFQEVVWLIQIASIAGIAYCLLRKKQKERLPFVPFLFLAYSSLILLRHII